MFYLCYFRPFTLGMRNFLFALSALLVSCQGTKSTPDNPVVAIEPVAGSAESYAQTISEEELKELLYIYASDEFEGRETGTPGEAKAVEFLVQYYKAAGVSGGISEQTYRQQVPLKFNAAPEGTLTVGKRVMTNGDGFISFTSVDIREEEVVYVGYGIHTEVYSDYGDRDVEGKVVLARHGEPVNADGTYLLSGTDNHSAWGNPRQGLSKRMEAVREKGARGLIYVSSEAYDRALSYFNRMKRSGDKRLVLQSEAEDAFSVVMDDQTAGTLFPGWEEQPSSNHGHQVAIDLRSQSTEVDSHNVIAYIKGRTKPNEFVILSAHLDHIGKRGNQINNGADDDGSGTVALLEIAEAFRQAELEGFGPERSIVFLHVTGEEKGLFGSKYYTDTDPIFPLDKTIADLNIDMIGRIDPKREGDRNYIYLIGSDKLSSELHRISEEVNAECCGLTLDYTYNRKDDPNRFYYRSDHYNFAKNNIPVIFYFNGTHADYHRPGDTPDKINYDLLQNRARLVFYTAWELANREKAVEVDPDKKIIRP